ncbi:GntR family transcriptional regulator [Pseudoflavonifractor sp. 60]|uniref:GntR family transcriptional regulator n=1 Tax=Pseudoflavonifractor sp. 60 TaxID=2304576 RepID=UPI00136B35F6|nr:GntR family transcriptional regulator [Pseudoflavonifractor sp. 60]NBI65863.1 GntR family transcriptional regulator [Pseudoflavonifractor sp. 60]
MVEYRPLQESAYNHVRDQVLSGQLQPGVLYSETKMAAELNISRTPMKDALVRLSQERLIDILPSKGFRLHQMSREDILQTCQARTAVEGFCAMQLSRSPSTAAARETLRAMEEAQAAMGEFLQDGGEMEAFLDCDLQFHQALVDFSGNAELRQLFNSYHYRLYFIAREAFQVEGRFQKAYEEHRTILDAVAGDPSGARAYLAVMGHMEATRDILLAHHQ